MGEMEWEKGGWERGDWSLETGVGTEEKREAQRERETEREIERDKERDRQEREAKSMGENTRSSIPFSRRLWSGQELEGQTLISSTGSRVPEGAWVA